MNRFFYTKTFCLRPRLPSMRFSIPNASSFGRRTFSPARQMMSAAEEVSATEEVNATEKDPDPFNYTSGRWLRQDALQQKARYIQFDFDALRRKVVALCHGATSITSYTKKEGGFNRVFIFHTDNAKRIVARLPFPAAGPRRLITSSEVATIQFLQKRTSIPIPKILEWSDDPSAIGSEYIIMEHAPGISLSEKWPTMSLHQRLFCINSIALKLQELADLDFPAYGSLYFADTPYITRMIPFNQEFSIGPHCGLQYWDCIPGQPQYFHDVDPNQGPWTNLTAYCEALADNGIARLPPVDPPVPKPRYHGSVQTHRQLIEQGRAVLKALAIDPLIQNAGAPTMIHPDLHKRNIFVMEDDPTVISAFLDWQSTSIEPAFWYTYETPDFAEPVPDPSKEDGKEPDSWACARAFYAGIMLLAPKLRPARSMDETCFRPFRYIFRTWKDSAVAFREELIEISRRWKELGLTVPCPFTMSCPEEVKHHQQGLELFHEVYDLKKLLSTALKCATNGFVPPEQWEEAESKHQWIFYGTLREVLLANEQPDNESNIKTEEDLREVWPFDLPERELTRS